MAKAQVRPHSKGPGYFYNAGSFEEVLFNETPKMPNFLPALHRYLIEYQGRQHPQDLIYDAFIKYVKIDFAFAKELHRLDVFSPDVFEPENEIGEAIIELLRDVEMQFVVHMRYYSDKETMEIDTYCCHQDYLYNLQEELMGEVYGRK